jgi:DNA-directed RNA polymerase specialized sigma24 family protein
MERAAAWDEWGEEMLRLDVQRALDALSARERALVEALVLCDGSLARAAREVGLSLREASLMWESVRAELAARLAGYGGDS